MTLGTFSRLPGFQACATDYKALDSKPSTRSRRALEEAMAGGIDRAKAVSYIALSWRESNVEWTTPRDSDWDGNPPEVALCGCRTAVGPELLDWGAVYADAQAIDFLSSLGMLGADGKVRESTIAGNPSDLAAFLEFTIRYRKINLLPAFSLGPTQQHLRWSALNGKNVKGWPDTWEEIWALYTSSSVVELLHRIVYLDPSVTGKPFPGSPGGDPKAKSIAWLTNHAGNTADAIDYWDGYDNALYVTNTVADDLGYPY